MSKSIALCISLITISALYSQQNNSLINSAEYISKGISLHDEGKYKQAIEVYSKIDRSDTNYYQALYEMAFALQADSQMTESLRKCEEGLAKPNNYWPQLYTLYGSLIDDMGNPERALRIFDSAIAMYPAYTELRLNQGTTLLKIGKYKEAESVFKESILINPYESSSHYKMGLSTRAQGKIMESFMCFLNYLLLNPSGKFHTACITQMSQIAKNTDEIQENIRARPDDFESPFELLEKIVLSKIALDKNYRTLIKLDDPITRQIQVLLEKMEFDPSVDDFWMQYYVPLFKKFYQEKKFEAFVYRIFSAVNLDVIQNYLKKNKDEQQELIQAIISYYNQIRSTRELNYTRRIKMSSLYHYEDGKLYAKGMTTDNGNILTGLWEFCFSTGNLRTRGMFNNKGEKQGEWNYYHFNGQLRGKQFFENDVQQGDEVFYYENGQVSSIARVINGEPDGINKIYYLPGAIKEIRNFKAGKLDGSRQLFYSNGNMKEFENYKDDSLHGDYQSFYQSGILESVAQYARGLLEGPFTSYHENGKKSMEGSYKAGKLDGNLKRYHSNGKLKSEANYVEGELEGIYKEFYDNDTLYYKAVFKNGKQQGATEYFDRDGIRFCVFEFDKSIITWARYYDKSGKEITHSERKGKKIELTGYTPAGYKKNHAIYNENGMIEGVEISYYASGKISAETNYKNGIQNGLTTTYYANGKKATEVEYLEGQKHGYEKTWYQNGQIQLEGWYAHDSRQGIWLEYDNMGNLKNKVTYRDNDIDGYNEEYFPNGKLSSIANYKLGWIENFIQFDTTGKQINYCEFKNSNGKYRAVVTNGKLYAEGEYVYGDLHGAYKFYFPDATLSSIQYYKRGLIDSVIISSFHNGKVYLEGQYRLGDKTGVWKYFHDTGKLNFTESYEDGALQGRRTYYFDDGSIDSETEYDRGYKHGISKKYDPDGSLLYQIRYNYDLPIAYTYQDKNGKLIPEIPLPGGNGKVIAYFSNGKKSAEFEYADGYLNGSNTLYYANGKIRKQSIEDFHLSHGPYKYFYPNGQPELEYTFFQDNLHGNVKVYYETGVLKEEGYNYNGLTHGTYKYYNEGGKLIETRVYFYGDLLEIKKHPVK